MNYFSKMKQKKTFRLSKLSLLLMVVVVGFLSYRSYKSYARPGCSCKNDGAPNTNAAQVFTSTSDEPKYVAPPSAARPVLARIGVGLLTPKATIMKAFPRLGGKR